MEDNTGPSPQLRPNAGRDRLRGTSLPPTPPASLCFANLLIYCPSNLFFADSSLHTALLRSCTYSMKRAPACVATRIRLTVSSDRPFSFSSPTASLHPSRPQRRHCCISCVRSHWHSTGGQYLRDRSHHWTRWPATAFHLRVYFGGPLPLPHRHPLCFRRSIHGGR
jgi:hypothetical protein